MPPEPDVETPAQRTTRRLRERTEWAQANPGQSYPGRWDERAQRDSQLMAEYERKLPKCLDNLLRELERTRYVYDERGNLIQRTDWADRPGAIVTIWRTVWWRPAATPSRRTVSRSTRSLTHTDAIARGSVFALPQMTARYRYDAFGRRVVKEVLQSDGQTQFTVFVWDGDVLLMEECFTRGPRKLGPRVWPKTAPNGPAGPEYGTLVREDQQDEQSLPKAQSVSMTLTRCSGVGRRYTCMSRARLCRSRGLTRGRLNRVGYWGTTAIRCGCGPRRSTRRCSI